MRTLVLLFALTLSCLAQPLSLDDPAYTMSTSSLRRGLVGYWRMEDNGDTYYDRSPSGIHLINSNSVSQASGKVGYSGLFESASDRCLLHASSAATSIGAGSFSIAAWVKIVSKTANQGYATVDDNASTAGSEWFLGYEFSSDHVLFQVEGASTHRAEDIVPPSTNTWLFLQGSYDASNQEVYFRQNDNLFATNTVTLPIHSTATAFSIGSCGGAGSFADAYIDEVGIWNRMLTRKEWQQLYAPLPSVNTITLNGTTQWSNTPPAALSGNVNCVWFNGTSGYASSGASIAVGGVNTLISVWANASDDFTGVILGNSAVANTYLRFVDSTTIRFQTDTGATFKDFTVPAMSTNTWYNILVYHDMTGSCHVYLNGTESASGGQAQNNTTTINQVARYWNGSSGLWFKGLVSQLEIYSVIHDFVPADVATLYSGQSLCIPKLRVAFLEGTGTTCRDTGYVTGSGQGVTHPRFKP